MIRPVDPDLYLRQIAVRRHALRRLDPFLGVTQVVESEMGRGLSVDGVNCETQLRAPLRAPELARRITQSPD